MKIAFIIGTSLYLLGGWVVLIRLLWHPVGDFTVRVYKYTRMGTRSIVWEKQYCTQDSARSAGQGVMFYLDEKDTEHAYTFTVYQTNQLEEET